MKRAQRSRWSGWWGALVLTEDDEQYGDCDYAEASETPVPAAGGFFHGVSAPCPSPSGGNGGGLDANGVEGT